MPHTDEQPKMSKRLDRDNLPDEFTGDFLKSVLPRDLVWLERDAEMTPRQRETFTAWSADRFRSFNEVGAATRKMMEGFKLPEGTLGKWFRSTMPSGGVLGRQRDPLGDDIRKTVSALNDLTGPPHNPALYHAKRQHDEQQQSLRQLYEVNEVNEAMRQLMLQLVTRTEQQHEEAKRQQLAAERQKTTNWLLACVAGASMIGTFATVQGSTRMWLALAATWIIVAVLYVVMHHGGSSGESPED